jgi:hypothetical protein
MSALLVCVGAVALVPAIAHQDEAAFSFFSNGYAVITPASGQAALTGGALAPEAPDSTDNDDDDGDEELPGGSVVLPAVHVTSVPIVVAFVAQAGDPVVRTAIVDAHSLRAPPQ